MVHGDNSDNINCHWGHMLSSLDQCKAWKQLWPIEFWVGVFVDDFYICGV
jgi:hypothetical protein